MKTSTIPTLLGPDGMTSLREYAGYHGGGSGFGGQLRAWNPPSESVDAALLPNFTRGNARADDLVRNNGYGRCEQVPDMRSSYSSGAHPRGTS